jgi:hypothetical protein
MLRWMVIVLLSGCARNHPDLAQDGPMAGLDANADTGAVDGKGTQEGSVAPDGSSADSDGPSLPPPAPQVCSQDDWCWENPLPAGVSLAAVVGSPTDLWVGGYHNLIHFDGKRWVHGPFYVQGRIDGALDDGTNGIYMVAGVGILRFDGKTWQTEHSDLNLYAVGATGAGELLAVGGGVTAKVVHRKAGKWSPMTLPGTTSQLNGVWGSGGQAFAVGQGGQIYRYDGSAWTKVSSGTAQNLNGVAGSGPSDVHAVGKGGTILRYDGQSWQAASSPTSNDLSAVWLRQAGDGFAVGWKGTILRLQGTAWTLMASPTDKNLKTVGAVGTEVWAAGDQGTLLRFAGAKWSEVSTAVTRNHLHDAHGSGGELFAVCGGAIGAGGEVMRRTAKGWSVVHTLGDYLYGVFASSTTDVWAVGGKGTILHFDGTVWSSVSSGATGWLKGVWAGGPGDVVVVGDNGVVLRDSGSGFKAEASGTTEHLTDVTGTASGEVFAVGFGGTVLRSQSGGAWTKMSSGTTQNLNRIWAAGPKAVFAVGDGGTVLRYDGSGWSTITTPFTAHLKGVWGRSASDLYVAGYGGHIAHYDGKSWLTHKSGAHSGLEAVWGDATGGVWAVGGLGVVVHHP